MSDELLTQRDSPGTGPQPALRDGDLTLRPLVPDDAPALWAAGQADDIGRYTSIAWPFTLTAAEELIATAADDWRVGQAARFGIVFDAEHGPTLVGTASLLHMYPERSDAEVGYWLGTAGRGRGLARRAVTLLSDWTFASLGLAQLHLMVDLDNDASHAVALAAGYRRDGEVYWRHPFDTTKDGLCVVYRRHRGAVSSPHGELV